MDNDKDALFKTVMPVANPLNTDTTMDISQRQSSDDIVDACVSPILTIIPAEELEFFTSQGNKDSSDIISLSNTSEGLVAYKVKTTSPLKYCIRPATGIIQPNGRAEIHVYFNADQWMPMSKDRFLIMFMNVESDVAPSKHNKLFKGISRENYSEHRLSCKLGSIAPSPDGEPVASMPIQMSKPTQEMMEVSTDKAGGDREGLVMSPILTIIAAEDFDFSDSEDYKENKDVLSLSNASDKHVAFKIKVTSPKRYCVRPATGVIKPHGQTDINVYLIATGQSIALNSDKFLVMFMKVDADVRVSKYNNPFQDISLDSYIEKSLCCKLATIKYKDMTEPETNTLCVVMRQACDGLISLSRSTFMILGRSLLVLLLITLIALLFEQLPIGNYVENAFELQTPKGIELVKAMVPATFNGGLFGAVTAYLIHCLDTYATLPSFQV